MRNSLLENKVFNNTEKISFNINKLYKLKNNRTVKAFASVIFDDEIEVECRIMQGKEGLWIAWPSTKVNNEWIKNFKFINKNLQSKVESKLIIDYNSVFEQ
ncbi:MAG: SpoVG family protein [Endomicrobium sp.]|nr:SpoVG family protein [Endomicrobium sp.]